VHTLPGADTDSDHSFGLKELHHTDENHKVLNEKTRMGIGEVICSMTENARQSTRKTQCSYT
jgi:hypothetical protein